MTTFQQYLPLFLHPSSSQVSNKMSYTKFSSLLYCFALLYTEVHFFIILFVDKADAKKIRKGTFCQYLSPVLLRHRKSPDIFFGDLIWPTTCLLLHCIGVGLSGLVDGRGNCLYPEHWTISTTCKKHSINEHLETLTHVWTFMDNRFLIFSSW